MDRDTINALADLIDAGWTEAELEERRKARAGTKGIETPSRSRREGTDR
jgi:hypothetical protein